MGRTHGCCPPRYSFSLASDMPVQSLPAVAKTPFERFLLGSSEAAVDGFLRSWPPDLIFRLRALNSSFFFAIEAYVTRAWSVESALRPWLWNSEGFMRVLEWCGGVISGSVAVQFLGRQAFAPRNLDVYVPLRGLLRLGRYLQEVHYVYEPTEDMHQFFDVAALTLSSVLEARAALQPGHPASVPTPVATFNFCRPKRFSWRLEDSLASHVQVVVTAELDPVQFILTSFHSSECSSSPCWRQRPMTESVCSRGPELHRARLRRFPLPSVNVLRAAQLRVSGYQAGGVAPSRMDGEVSCTGLRDHQCGHCE